jgi:FkbM family methyltransferase
MLKANLAIEVYKRFLPLLPSRLRLAMKRYINADLPIWAKLGTRVGQLNGTPYQLELNMRHWHQRWTYIKGHYPEPHVTQLLSEVLKKDSVYIDIGANIGVHCVYAASFLASASQIWAIEPNPHSFSRLKANAELNQLSEMNLHQLALGNQNGTVRLENCDDENVGTTLRHNAAEGCETPIRKGDELFAAIPASAQGICKIDVEGFELEVLRGMQQFIHEHPQMSYVVEVTPEWLSSLGDSAEKLFQVFLAEGFQAYEIVDGSDRLLPLSKPIDKSQYDVFFSIHLGK